MIERVSFFDSLSSYRLLTQLSGGHLIKGITEFYLNGRGCYVHVDN